MYNFSETFIKNLSFIDNKRMIIEYNHDHYSYSKLVFFYFGNCMHCTHVINPSPFKLNGKVKSTIISY